MSKARKVQSFSPVSVFLLVCGGLALGYLVWHQLFAKSGSLAEEAVTLPAGVRPGAPAGPPPGAKPPISHGLVKRWSH